MESLGIKSIFLESYRLYKKSCPILLVTALPLFALGDLFPYLMNYLPSYLSVLLGIISLLIISFANATSIKLMHDLTLVRAGSAIKPLEFFWYLFAGGYIAFAYSLTASLIVFAIPALLLFVVTLFSPIYVLCYNEGPFQAIGSSAEVIRGNVIRIVLILLSYIPLILVIGGVLGMLTNGQGFIIKAIDYVVTLAIKFLWLFHSAVTVVLFAKLHPNKSLKDAP